jgi:hypothetical protein
MKWTSTWSNRKSLLKKVHQNLPPSSLYKHGILYEKDRVSAEVKTGGPVA